VAAPPSPAKPPTTSLPATVVMTPAEMRRIRELPKSAT
jgi:hypothetical protein